MGERFSLEELLHLVDLALASQVGNRAEILATLERELQRREADRESKPDETIELVKLQVRLRKVLGLPLPM